MLSTAMGGDSLSKAVLSADRLNVTSAVFDNDWQQVMMHEKQRMKRKERENRSIIHRLTKDLKREQEKNLNEVTFHA